MKLNKMTLIAALAVSGLLTLGTGANAQDAATNTPAMTPAPAHPPMRRRAPNVEMIAKMLNLSDEQKTNVLAAMTERTAKVNELHHDTSVAPADRPAKMKEITDAYTAKMKEILTPEQFAKFQKTMMPHPRPAPTVAPAAGTAAPATPPAAASPN